MAESTMRAEASMSHSASDYELSQLAPPRLSELSEATHELQMHEAELSALRAGIQSQRKTLDVEELQTTELEKLMKKFAAAIKALETRVEMAKAAIKESKVEGQLEAVQASSSQRQLITATDMVKAEQRRFNEKEEELKAANDELLAVKKALKAVLDSQQAAKRARKAEETRLENGEAEIRDDQRRLQELNEVSTELINKMKKLISADKDSALSELNKQAEVKSLLKTEEKKSKQVDERLETLKRDALVSQANLRISEKQQEERVSDLIDEIDTFKISQEKIDTALKADAVRDDLDVSASKNKLIPSSERIAAVLQRLTALESRVSAAGSADDAKTTSHTATSTVGDLLTRMKRLEDVVELAQLTPAQSKAVDTLKTKVAAAAEAKVEAGKAELEVQKKRDEAAELKKQAAELQADMLTADRTIDAAQNEVHNQEKALAEKKEAVARETALAAKIQAELNDALKRREKLKLEVDTARTRVKLAKKEIAEFTKAGASAKVAEATLALKKEAQKLDQQKLDLAEFKKTLRDQEELLSKQQARVREAQAEAERGSKLVADAKEAVKKATDQKQNKLNQVHQHQAKLDQVNIKLKEERNKADLKETEAREKAYKVDTFVDHESSTLLHVFSPIVSSGASVHSLSSLSASIDSPLRSVSVHPLSSQLAEFSRAESAAATPLVHILESSGSGESSISKILQKEAAKSSLQSAEAKKEVAKKEQLQAAQAVLQKKQEVVDTKKEVEKRFDELNKVSKDLTEKRTEVRHAQIKVEELKGDAKAADIDVERVRGEIKAKTAAVTEQEIAVKDAETKIEKLKVALAEADRKHDKVALKADTAALATEEKHFETAKNNLILAKKELATSSEAERKAVAKLEDLNRAVRLQQEKVEEKRRDASKLARELNAKVDVISHEQKKLEMKKTEASAAEMQAQSKKDTAKKLESGVLKAIKRVIESSSSHGDSHRSSSGYWTESSELTHGRGESGQWAAAPWHNPQLAAAFDDALRRQAKLARSESARSISTILKEIGGHSEESAAAVSAGLFGSKKKHESSEESSEESSLLARLLQRRRTAF